MKRLIALLLVLALGLGLSTAAFGAELPYAGKTVILYTGNILGRIDIYPQIKALKDSYAAKGAQVLLVDAGNYLRGTAWANASMGQTVYELMDAAGYDAAAMGPAEFGWNKAVTGYPYHQNVTRYYTQAMLQNGTPEISYKTGSAATAPTKTLAARGPAGFTAICSHVEALAGTEGPVYAFQRWAEFPAGGLSFRFVDGDRNEFLDQVQDGYLAQRSQEERSETQVDFTVALCTEADPPALEDPHCDKLLTLMPSAEGNLMGGVIVIDNNSKAVSQETLSLSAKDETLAAQVEAIKAGTQEPLFYSQVNLEGRDSASRRAETNLGDLVTDALLWYAGRYVDGIDKRLPMVAVQNGGNLDDFLFAGEVTETDLLHALPFSPMGIGVIQLTGRQLLELLEAGCQTEPCAGFAQVSGLSYTIDPDRAFDPGAAYGKFYRAASLGRVSIDQIGGKAFDENGLYNVVFDNFLIRGSSGQGGDTYYVLSDARDAGAPYVDNGTGVKTRDIVEKYVNQALGGSVGQAYDHPQGRIRFKLTPVTPPAWAIFEDVRPNAFYAKAVDWAVGAGVTKGTSKTSFSPDEPCTREQVVTFLWRAFGSPAPTLSRSPFTDVKAGGYSEKAILWALEQGITRGVSDTSFNPTGACTRGEVATFLHRALGKPAPAGDASVFVDLRSGAFYLRAVTWAVGAGVTKGTDGTHFSPDRSCTRGEIVTFLYRALA